MPAGRGQELTIQKGTRLLSGRGLAGIAADGAMLLDTPHGRERLFSGVPLPPTKGEG